MNAYIRYGVPKFHRFWGAGFEVVNLLNTQRISLHARFDVWDQPSLILGEEGRTTSHAGLGGAVFGTLLYKIAKLNSRVSLTAQIGYKTAGFLEGEKLAEGFIARIGLSFTEL